MPAPYSKAQLDVARESWNFWRSKLAGVVQAGALLDDEDGETSFVTKAVGDRGEAFSLFQWHLPRIEIMLENTGIDVRTASHSDCLKAAFWEMTDPKSSYRHVWPNLMAAQTEQDCVTVLVRDYEQSGSQARDVARRTGFQWVEYAKANNWP